MLQLLKISIIHSRLTVEGGKTFHLMKEAFVNRSFYE